MVSGVDFPLNQSIESWKAFFWEYDMKLFMVKFHHAGFMGSKNVRIESDITNTNFSDGEIIHGSKKVQT
jgi:hypothetical protein